MQIRSVTTTVTEPGCIGRTMEPMPEELVPEIMPKEEAYCALHISKEGYRQWELSQQEGGLQTEETVQQAQEAVPAEPAQEAETGDRRVKAVMGVIDERANVVNRTGAKATKETDDEKAEALEQLRQLKEEQQAEYQKKEQEAQELAKEQTKVKSETERGMRDLAIMLESFKPMDDREEKDSASAGQREEPEQVAAEPKEQELSGAEERKEEIAGIGRGIKSQAFRAELAMDDTIDQIYQRAQENLKAAKDCDGNIRDGLESVYQVLAGSGNSEEEKDAAVDEFLKNGGQSLAAMRENLSTGLERMRNVRELRRERVGNQNMVYASRAADAIGELASQTAVDQLYQDGYEAMKEESIEELAERIQKLQKDQQTSAENAVPEEKEPDALHSETEDLETKLQEQEEEQA